MSPHRTDVVTDARALILERGVGLTEEQALACPRLPDDRLPELRTLGDLARKRSPVAERLLGRVRLEHFPRRCPTDDRRTSSGHSRVTTEAYSCASRAPRVVG
jgi:hypothetical protein